MVTYMWRIDSTYKEKRHIELINCSKVTGPQIRNWRGGGAVCAHVERKGRGEQVVLPILVKVQRKEGGRG